MAGKGGITGYKELIPATALAATESVNSEWVRYDSSVKGTIYALTASAGTPEMTITLWYSPYRKEQLDGLSSVTTAYYETEELTATHAATTLTSFTSTNLDKAIASVKLTIAANAGSDAITAASAFISTFDID